MRSNWRSGKIYIHKRQRTIIWQVKDCFRKIACVLAGIDVKVSSKKVKWLRWTAYINENKLDKANAEEKNER